MATAVASGTIPSPAADEARVGEIRHLHGAAADFLLLGGLSFLLFPLTFLLPLQNWYVPVGFWALALSNVINHPHFAHSYQIFYQHFGSKLTSPDRPKWLRVRYAIAGIAVPVILVVFFLFGILTGNARLVGLGGNIMALFVGWHYVKQGYGMLMVDAVMKRRFFNDREKKVLLANAYAVWTTAWLFINREAAENQLWGLQYYSLDMPGWVLATASVAVAMTSLAAAWTLIRRLRAGQKLPWTGVMAYAVSLYLWTLFARINPLWLLVLPALHSIQYLAVVYRFQANLEKAEASSHPDDGPWERLLNSYRTKVALFGALGLLLGGGLFWGLPKFLDASVNYERGVFGPTLFLFLFWVIINVHHYFMDSVMWRRDNPETKLHLFS